MNFKSLFISGVLIVSFLSCKDSSGSKTSTTNINHTSLNKPVDLNYHLETALKYLKNSRGIEQKLSNDVYLRGFGFYKKGENHYDLILELQNDITNDMVSKYTFAVEGFVTEDEEAKLSEYSKTKNRLYDAWYGTAELTRINNHCYVIIDVKTKIDKFDLIKFYLFDRQGYNGDVGERIIFYDYNI
ncbi:hypothetical protein [Formosa haliotis]|uniref:hypothetical protein n=1 Tax=Formosa haliotis TaxID=1555194 RepID=UPI0008244D32|nr:hypothetical protein [Formosa haliotis]